jgi:hypothetical protein
LPVTLLFLKTNRSSLDALADKALTLIFFDLSAGGRMNNFTSALCGKSNDSSRLSSNDFPKKLTQKLERRRSDEEVYFWMGHAAGSLPGGGDVFPRMGANY